MRVNIMTLSTNTVSNQQALVTEHELLAISSKKRSLMLLARTELLGDEGLLITGSVLAKAPSMETMKAVKDSVGFNLNYFHDLGFLSSGIYLIPSACNVADTFAGCAIKLDAKVFSQLVTKINKALRAVAKHLIDVEDAGKFIARLVKELKQLHEAVILECA
jgi:hypothetical protein